MSDGWWHRNAPGLFNNGVDWSRWYNYNALFEPRTFGELHQRQILDNILPWKPYSVYDQDKRIKRALEYSGYDVSDILYPSEWDNAVGTGASQTLNFLSRNIEKLYKNW